MPVRYGRSVATSTDGLGITMIEEEKYHDWKTVTRTVRYTESRVVKNDKEVLAEFLKLLDQHKNGDIAEFGLQCFVGRDGEAYRIEKSWTNL